MMVESMKAREFGVGQTVQGITVSIHLHLQTCLLHEMWEITTKKFFGCNRIK